MRHFGARGRRGRGSPRSPIRSYKKVINVLPASYGSSGFSTIVMATGKDGISAGQTANTDGDVPTGCLIKYIEIQCAFVNLVATACHISTSISYVLPAQSAVDPIAVGGDNKRNQIMHLDLFGAGDGQNTNRVYKFKIPKQFQRMSEGKTWNLTFNHSATISFSMSAIYKFYQ